MCLLTVYPMPGLLDGKGIERLSNGANLNPHGSGWAVVSDGRILTGKSMDGETAIEGFAESYKHATGPALFHSRWATHGSKSTVNVHPFPVKRVGGMVVAHNGVLPTDSWPDKGDDRSDTRVFADDVLPDRFKRLDSEKVRDHLEDWLAGNKIAVLTVNRKYRRNLYLFGMDAGHWEDGVWYSNHDYEGVTAKYAGVFGKNSWGSNEECAYCESWGAIDNYGYCGVCETCQDCLERANACQCFAGSSTNVTDIAKEAVLAASAARHRSPAEESAFVFGHAPDGHNFVESSPDDYYEPTLTDGIPPEAVQVSTR